jgi:Family of unknown function (DUF5681)
MTSRDDDEHLDGERPAEGASYGVGYGRPPKATRFKPGQSGNPKGRPKGSRKVAPDDVTVEQMKALLLKEAYRHIKIRDGDEMVEMPILQAAIRNVALQAAQGKQGAQRILFELVAGIEQQRRRTREQLFETVVEYKCDSEARIAAARRLGLPEPDLLPHPGDLIVDPIAGSVISRGPWTVEEKAELDRLRHFRAGLQEDLELEQSQPAEDVDPDRIAALECILARVDELLSFERVILAPTAAE